MPPPSRLRGATAAVACEDRRADALPTHNFLHAAGEATSASWSTSSRARRRKGARGFLSSTAPVRIVNRSLAKHSARRGHVARAARGGASPPRAGLPRLVRRGCPRHLGTGGREDRVQHLPRGAGAGGARGGEGVPSSRPARSRDPGEARTAAARAVGAAESRPTLRGPFRIVGRGSEHMF